jgi:hypothetical protein
MGFYEDEHFNFEFSGERINAFVIFKESYLKNFNQNEQLLMFVKNYLFSLLNLKSFNFNIHLDKNNINLGIYSINKRIEFTNQTIFKFD